MKTFTAKSSGSLVIDDLHINLDLWFIVVYMDYRCPTSSLTCGPKLYYYIITSGHIRQSIRELSSRVEASVLRFPPGDKGLMDRRRCSNASQKVSAFLNKANDRLLRVCDGSEEGRRGHWALWKFQM